MKQSIGWGDFTNAFERMGRGEQFSYDGLEVLYDYLTELEDSSGEEIELDVIGLCCDYAEGTAEEIANDYDIDIEDLDEDEAWVAVMEYLDNNTIVCGQTDSGNIVYQQF